MSCPFVSVIIPVLNDGDRLRLCLQALQEQSYSHYEIMAGIIGGQIQFFFQGNDPNPIEYADSISYLRQWDYVTQEHYAAGAHLFTRRQVLDQVVGFEERLLNLGDKEWGQRVYAAGWQVVFCSGAIVHHPARSTSRHC